MEFSSNPHTKCTKTPQCSISVHPFSDVSSQKYLNSQVRTNKLGYTVFFTTLVLQDQPQGYFHISLNSLGFYISRECFLGFYISRECLLNFFTFLETAFNLCIYMLAPLPHSKLPVEGSKYLFPQIQKGWKNL